MAGWPLVQGSDGSVDPSASGNVAEILSQCPFSGVGAQTINHFAMIGLKAGASKSDAETASKCGRADMIRHVHNSNDIVLAEAEV